MFIEKDALLIQETFYNLNMQTQKVLLFMIGKIKEPIIENKIYSFTVKEYCEYFRINGFTGTNYKSIKKNAEKLVIKNLIFKGEKISWLDSVYTRDNSGVVRYSFTPLLIPYLNYLTNHTLKYDIKNIKCLKSKYSIKLYELLLSYDWMYIDLSIKELRDRLGIEDKQYPRFSNFKQTVLDVAVNEINSKTNLKINYVLKKSESRCYTNIIFGIKK